MDGPAKEGRQGEARGEAGVACEAEGRLLGGHGWGRFSREGACCADDLCVHGIGNYDVDFLRICRKKSRVCLLFSKNSNDVNVNALPMQMTDRCARIKSMAGQPQHLLLFCHTHATNCEASQYIQAGCCHHRTSPINEALLLYLQGCQWQCPSTCPSGKSVHHLCT